MPIIVRRELGLTKPKAKVLCSLLRLVEGLKPRWDACWIVCEAKGDE